MISASELSVGDIIMPVTVYKDGTERPSPIMRIVNIGDDYVYATIDGMDGDPFEYDIEEIRGAEITPDFLLKNKFANNLQIPTKGTDSNIGFVYSTKDGLTKIGGIHFIHQLQHAMRLCKKTKEADRLKL